MSNLLLGIDVGTFSSKGVLANPDGTVLKTHVAEHFMDIPHPGWADRSIRAIYCETSRSCSQMQVYLKFGSMIFVTHLLQI